MEGFFKPTPASTFSSAWHNRPIHPPQMLLQSNRAYRRPHANRRACADNTLQAIGHALELHGEGLEALNLAGCRSLDASLTVASVQKWCKRLATLDISGTAFEDDGRVGYIPSPVTPPGFPVGRRRRLPQDSGGIFGGRGSEFGAEGTHSLQQVMAVVCTASTCVLSFV